MSHDSTHHQHQGDQRPTTYFRSSFWFVVILAGLFIAGVNFVNVMGHDEGEGHDMHMHENTGHGTEVDMKNEHTETHEAPANILEGDTTSHPVNH